ncbi:hypothetical protein ACRW1C_24320 [Escherichia coli]
MGSCAAPSAKGDDKFITTDYLQQCQAIKPMTARQKQARATAVCEGYAQRTQFANPSVAYSMCLKGAQSTPEKCTRDNTHFSSEATKLTGASRAEYTEIGNAFRIGCNLN